MLIAGFNKTSFVDYPGVISSVVFTPYCNMNCWYCHNRHILAKSGLNLVEQGQVMDYLVPSYLSGVIFGALVESYCSEQNARMTAMKTSSDNAREMLKDLNLVYNRARQSAITQEITEVVGGAGAQA